LTAVETLRRITEILDRLAAGERPSARDLADAPLAQSWSIMTGEELYRIGAVIAMPHEIRERPRVAPLLAIDRTVGWALVLVDDRIVWWVLGNPLPGGATSEEPAEIVRRAAAWTRRRLP
jgi:hypothetical protein